jgi:ribosomal protein S6
VAVPAEIGSQKGVALYEHVFLARQDLSQAQVDALAATATEIVEANQGKVTKTETWGLKNLAYKIKRNRKAHFVMLNIEAPPARRRCRAGASDRDQRRRDPLADRPRR